MKKVKNTDEAQNVQYKFDPPSAWIQWNGTDVCMDWDCVCGAWCHLDGNSAYHIKCPKCGRVYFVNGHIQLIELEEPPDDDFIKCQSSYEEDD
jgi:hypothetical protein